eukprot:626687-Pleurochrysis_carterae.AAC.1
MSVVSPIFASAPPPRSPSPSGSPQAASRRTERMLRHVSAQGPQKRSRSRLRRLDQQQARQATSTSAARGKHRCLAIACQS